jgi:23S rRNA G2445 N2-methylase RlmL
MCGSATLLIEALNLALGIAPGCTRRFAIERWPFASDLLRRELDRERRDGVGHARNTLESITKPLAVCADLDPAAVRAARKNLHAAGLALAVELRQADARKLELPPGSTILTNIPYGERLGGTEVTALYGELGAVWSRMPRTTAWILCGHEGFADAFGPKTTKARSLWNGPLPVTLWRCEL